VKAGKHFDPMVVNVDHDNKPPQELLESYVEALKIGQVSVYESPRKRGYHFSVSLDAPISIEQNYRIRALLGDDRMRMDIELPYVNDFLYAVRRVNGKTLMRERLTSNEFLRRLHNGGNAC